MNVYGEVDIRVDVECAKCGSALDANFRCGMAYIEPCDSCIEAAKA